MQDVLSTPTGQSKSRLMFPNLSMLDISNNQLREIPHNIHELNNLSVLNISGNLGEVQLEPFISLSLTLLNENIVLIEGWDWTKQLSGS